MGQDGKSQCFQGIQAGRRRDESGISQQSCPGRASAGAGALFLWAAARIGAGARRPARTGKPPEALISQGFPGAFTDKGKNRQGRNGGAQRGWGPRAGPAEPPRHIIAQRGGEGKTCARAKTRAGGASARGQSADGARDCGYARACGTACAARASSGSEAHSAFKNRLLAILQISQAYVEL